MEVFTTEMWTKVLDYGIVALIAVVLLVVLYRLFFRVLEAVRENSKVIAEVTKALDNNTRTIEGLGSSIQAISTDRAFIEGFSRALADNTKTLAELHKATVELIQKVTALCAIMEVKR